MSAALARTTIARLYLRRGQQEAPHLLGTIALRPHQRAAVERLRAIIDEFGGALLADDVGLGKTYVAATMVRDASSPLVIAPAALRAMWSSALEAAGVRAPFVSYEALSRGHVPGGTYDFLVLDEAHHVRTPTTRRYRRLTELASGARVLLLSATPIHNSWRDLAAPLALFLGASAWSLDERTLARCVVRRERQDITTADIMPEVGVPEWLHVCGDEALLDEILALPPPVPPSDGGDGGALVTVSLVRQWSSSHAALASGLRRRLARAGALMAALERGRYPSRSALTAWAFADDALQLAFPEVLAPESPDVEPLLRAVRAHEGALRALLRRVAQSSRIDELRAVRLRELRAAHPGEKIIVFTAYAATVSGLFGHLRRDRGVAALSARGGLVAGGSLPRDETIRRFAPLAAGLPPPRESERVDLLLATDLLSEGVNLQDASVVVHLELPWTPARLEQRVGRSRRLGARHARTAVYAFAPPAGAEALLRLDARLREKLRTAERLVGTGGSVLSLPGPTPRADEREEASVARRTELLRNALTRWQRQEEHGDAPVSRGRWQPHAPIMVSAVRSTRAGWLALLREGDEPILLAGLGGRLTDDPATVLEAVVLAGGADARVDGEALARAHETITRWIAERRAAGAAGSLTIACEARREALRRIATIAARAPHHLRPLLAPLVIDARRAATAPYGAGSERALGELVGTIMPDRDWLRALAAFGAAHARRGDRDSEPSPIELRVLLLLVAA